jgi:hypothetical protein
MSPIRLGLLGGVLICGALLLVSSGVESRPPARADEPTATPPNDVKATTNLPSPQTWPAGTVIYDQGEAEKKIREVLQKTDDFELGDAQLGDLAELLHKRHAVNIQLDAEALAADGKGAETPLTIKLDKLTVAKALRLILDPQGLTYLVKNDVLMITTKAAASQPENLLTRIYQVHDLVVAPNDPTARQPDFDSLIELITSTIRQQDWQDNGGTIGFLRAYDGPGILILTATHDERGHEEIEQLLKALRAARLQPIYDAQAQRPLTPPQPHSPGAYFCGGMGGGSGAPGSPAPPAAAGPSGTSPANTNQQRGGGFF